MHLKYLTDYQLSNKTVMLRVDMNVPIDKGIILNQERIDRCLPTIKFILEQTDKLILISHLGRPEETNKVQEEFSLRPVAKYLEQSLSRPIVLRNSLDELQKDNKDVVMLENIRFFKGEKSNDSKLAKNLAKLCDIFILDAFATSHRYHASTTGVINFAEHACAGFLVKEELEALQRMDKARRPIIAVLGGAKISSKLSLINALSEKVDYLILGGGIANTCLGSQGIEIGSSLSEVSMYEEAKILAEKNNVLLPKEVLVAKNKESLVRETGVTSLTREDCIFDISPNFVSSLEHLFNKAGTIIWNGPMGLFEIDKFFSGTKAVADSISRSSAYSIIGGGDTISAASRSGVLDSISYVSTAGGAFLEYLEGKSLPALSALEKKALESPYNGA